MRSHVIGFRLCGIIDEPFCFGLKYSSASRTSVRCKWRISVANLSIELAITANVVKNSACLSRCNVCDEIKADAIPSLRHTYVSTKGSISAYVPTAPEIFPTAIVSFARFIRSISRSISANQLHNFNPNVVASACIPCVRPIQGVYLNSTARRRNTCRNASKSSSNTSEACFNITPNAVSLTSVEVNPK